MKFLIAIAMTLLPCIAQDAVTLTIRNTKDNTTRTVNLTGEAATLIAKAADYIIRQPLAAMAITTTACIPSAPLETLAAAQRSADKALADEKKRLESLVTAATITETQP